MIKWYYSTHEIVTRIPEEVGKVWENGYINAGRCEQLTPFTAIPATSSFDGTHSGKGFGPEVLLAMDETRKYLLIKERRYVIDKE